MLSTVVLPQPEWPITQVNVAARDGEPQVLEDRGRAVALRDALDGDELVGHTLTPGT